MRNPIFAAAILLLCSVVHSVSAQQQRQHEAHQHGGGQLNVAVEQHSLMVELSLPAMNVVGFEHSAESENEQAELRRAADLLRDGKRLLGPNPEAKCTLIRSEIDSVLLDQSGQHQHEADEDGGHDDDHDQHQADEEGDHDDQHEHQGDEHADFDVVYEFSCAEPSRLDALTISLFELIPGTEHLTTQVIFPGGQGGGTLDAENRVLKLK